MSKNPSAFPQEESSFLLTGPSGHLEILTTFPKDENPNAIAIICHPHPLYGGTMQNKVVTTLAKTFMQLKLATVRFNFRGIGKSAGSFDQGIGETDDLLAVLAWVKSVLPKTNIWLAGFSFGAYIAAKVANQVAVAELISIAPAVNHGNFTKLTHIQCPWLIVQGDQDELVPVAAVKSFAAHPPSPLELCILPDASHFFHGKLIELKEVLLKHFSCNHLP